MTKDCPNQSALQDFDAGLLSAEKDSAIAAHINQCLVCQAALEKINTRDLPLLDSVQPSEPDSAVLLARLGELKAESLTDENASKDTRTMDLRPWLDKSTDQFGRQMVDEFELRECIGRGGMGVVFKALDTKLQRIVALKFMSPNLLASEDAKERFFREAQAAAAIAHVNVVAVHSVNQFDELPYLVMEFVAGETLAQRVEPGRLPLEHVIAIGKQIALGLAAAHSVGVQHRDIKPTNILMDGKVAKLGDFGLARVAASEVQTGTGTLVGTPEFIAPERIEPKLGVSDHRSDLFSLGAVLYTMTTGKAPFTGGSVLVTLKSICEDQPEPIAASCPDAPEWIVSLVSQLLSKRPEDRIQHASDVVQILNRQMLAHDRTTNPSADANNEVLRSRRLRLALVGFGLAFLAGITFWGLYSWQNENSEQPQPVSQSTNGADEAALETNVKSEAEYIRVESEGELIELLSESSAGDVAISLAGEEYWMPGLEIENRNITLIAASGFRPTLFFSTNRNGAGLTATEVELNLRGIRIQSDFESDDEVEHDEEEALLLVDGGKLNMEDCSIEHPASTPCLVIREASAEIIDCTIHAPDATAFLWQPSEEHRLEMEDNVVVSEIQFDLVEPFGASILLRRNTFVGRSCIEYGRDEEEHSLVLTTQNNTFACSEAMFVLFDDDADSDTATFDWLRWRSVADILPGPLLQQILESDEEEERTRTWTRIEDLTEFKNVSLDASRQESKFLGLSIEELESQVSEGELTPEAIRRAIPQHRSSNPAE